MKRPLLYLGLVAVAAGAALKRGPTNMEAFLETIKEGESGGDYNILTGGGSFKSFKDHPYITGEFDGIRNHEGKLSTAAGAYQITVTTWRDLRERGYDLPDFSPESQDAAARALIDIENAYDAIMVGDMVEARNLLQNRWVFLQSWDTNRLESVFQSNGGKIV